MKYTTAQILFSLALTVCSLALFSAPIHAANYTVTTTANDGSGSLREAITRANSSPADDTIDFAIPPTSPNCVGNGICTITLTTGEFVINATSSAGRLTITNSTGASRLSISGNNQSRIFYVSYNADLTLDGVTVKNGNGIGTYDYNANNTGGGIYVNYGGKLTVLNSAVTGNTAMNGGGIYNYNYFSYSSLTITNSTISGNTANFGGGVSNNWGRTTIVNSTISGNAAQTYGGGIYNNMSSTLTLINATVTNNRSDSAICPDCAGGVFNYGDVSAIVNMVNTIVAGNTNVNANAAPDFSGVVSAASSNNIVGNNKLTTGISNGVNGNQVGSPASPINALLSTLANNGGTTETHSLLPSSPAIDRGNNCVLYAGSCQNGNPALGGDQRGAGFPRQAGNAVDVGAVESTQSAGGNFEISGTVVYGNTAPGQGQRFVPGVTMSASGTSFASTITDSTGYYMLRNLISGGQYTVTPSKTGDASGITAFDATLVLRHVAAAGNGLLNANQRIAADTNNDGAVSAFDATQILRFVASGRPSALSGAAGEWKFVYSPLNNAAATNSITGENYNGFLMGEINGDWNQAAFLSGNELSEEKLRDDDQFDSLRHKETQVSVSLNDIATSESRGAIVVPVAFTNNSGTPISSFSFDIAYDPNVLQPIGQAVDFTDVLTNDAGCAVITDIATAGRIGIAASCPAIGIIGGETRLNLHFTVIGKARLIADASTALAFSQKPIFEDSNGKSLSAKIVSLSGK